LSVRFYLEIVGGIVLIIFGLLFFVYLQLNLSELVTVVVFVGGGALIIRRAFQNRATERTQRAQIESKRNGKTPSKAGRKKVP
jgi:uncharacterized membrane protein HdeD (DUF308 family)